MLTGKPASLLIVDIDHFKSFNDRFGHAAGDVVLLRIARIVMATVGADDAVFRYGGEEFVVIAPGLTRTAALTLGERIRRDVASHMDAEAAAPLVTVSIGLATCADDASDYDGLFECADRRLYLAKSAGRNCVVGEKRSRPARRSSPGRGDAELFRLQRRIGRANKQHRRHDHDRVAGQGWPPSCSANSTSVLR